MKVKTVRWKTFVSNTSSSPKELTRMNDIIGVSMNSTPSIAMGMKRVGKKDAPVTPDQTQNLMPASPLPTRRCGVSQDFHSERGQREIHNAWSCRALTAHDCYLSNFTFIRHDHGSNVYSIYGEPGRRTIQ